MSPYPRGTSCLTHALGTPTSPPVAHLHPISRGISAASHVPGLSSSHTPPPLQSPPTSTRQGAKCAHAGPPGDSSKPQEWPWSQPIQQDLRGDLLATNPNVRLKELRESRTLTRKGSMACPLQGCRQCYLRVLKNLILLRA